MFIIKLIMMHLNRTEKYSGEMFDNILKVMFSGFNNVLINRRAQVKAIDATTTVGGILCEKGKLIGMFFNFNFF